MHETIHAVIHDQARVLSLAIGALVVSYTGIMDALRAILLVVSIAYTTLKLFQAIKKKTSEDE